MNYEAAIAIAKQRMQEIGKTPEQYHMEVALITGSAAERAAKLIRLKGYNQYFYLVDYAKYKGLQINSDTGYFNADDYTNNTNQEFSGAIEISQLAGKTWSIEEFIGDPATGGEIVLHPIVFIRVTF